MRDFVARSAEALGGIDFLVNNAGGAHPGNFETLTDENWAADYDVKVFSLIRCCREVLPHMRSAGGGRIVNIGAVYSRYPDPTFFATSVNRAAGNSFTKTLALEVAKDNILVNGVNIGFVITPQWENIHLRRAPTCREEFFDTLRAAGGPARALRARRTRSLAWSRSCSASARATSPARRSTSPAAWAGTSSGTARPHLETPCRPRCRLADSVRASVHDIQSPRPPRPRPPRLDRGARPRFARTERGVATIALGAVALHIADDNFLQPEPGTSPTDHLASGLIPIAVITAAAAASPPRARRDQGRTRSHLRRARDRVRDPERLLALAGRGVGDHYTTGPLTIAAGVVLIATGLVVLWRSRRSYGSRRRTVLRRGLTIVASVPLAFAVFALVVFPVGFAYTYTHTGRGVVEPDLRVPYEQVTVTTSDSLELTGSYVRSKNRAAVILFPGATRSAEAGC